MTTYAANVTFLCACCAWTGVRADGEVPCAFQALSYKEAKQEAAAKQLWLITNIVSTTATRDASDAWCDRDVVAWVRQNAVGIEIRVPMGISDTAPPFTYAALPTTVISRNDVEYDRITGVLTGKECRQWCEMVERGATVSEAVVRRARELADQESLDLLQEVERIGWLITRGDGQVAMSRLERLWEFVAFGPDEAVTSAVSNTARSVEDRRTVAANLLVFPTRQIEHLGLSGATQCFQRLQTAMQRQLISFDRVMSLLLLNDATGDETNSLEVYAMVRHTDIGEQLRRVHPEGLINACLAHKHWKEALELIGSPISRVESHVRMIETGEDLNRVGQSCDLCGRLWGQVIGIYLACLKEGREREASIAANTILASRDRIAPQCGAIARSCLVMSALRANEAREEQLGWLLEADACGGVNVLELRNELEQALRNHLNTPGRTD